MISLLLSVALAAPSAAPNQAGIDNSRRALVACLKQVASSAKAGEVTTDGFAAFAKTRCAAEEDAFSAAMISFDVKNGVSRKSAGEGAQMALDDYVETAKNNFTLRTQP